MAKDLKVSRGKEFEELLDDVLQTDLLDKLKRFAVKLPPTLKRWATHLEMLQPLWDFVRSTVSARANSNPRSDRPNHARSLHAHNTLVCPTAGCGGGRQAGGGGRSRAGRGGARASWPAGPPRS